MSYQHLSGCLYTRPVHSQLDPTWPCIPAAIKIATPKHNDQQARQGDKGNQTCHMHLCKIQIAQNILVAKPTIPITRAGCTNASHADTAVCTFKYMPVQCCVLNISKIPNILSGCQGILCFPLGNQTKFKDVKGVATNTLETCAQSDL